MNHIKKFSDNLMDKSYQNIYSTFLSNHSNDHDKDNSNKNGHENILIINQNYFNPLLYYSHYIKKYDVNLYILFNNHESINKLHEEIDHEECKNLIHYNLLNLEQVITEYQNIQFDKLILVHIHSIEYLKQIMDIARFFKINIYIYISLTTKNKVTLKNTLRSLFKKVSDDDLGCVFDYDEIFNLLNSHDYFTIESINMINNNHYITYGSHKSYLFILKYEYQCKSI